MVAVKIKLRNICVYIEVIVRSKNYVRSLAKGPQHCYGIFSKNPNDAGQASYLWNRVVKCCNMSYLILRWTPKDLNCQKTGEVCRLQANSGAAHPEGSPGYVLAKFLFAKPVPWVTKQSRLTWGQIATFNIVMTPDAGS